MAALSSALDSINNLKLGENNNLEYKWNSDFNELVVQYYFQLTRSENIENLKKIFNILLNKIFIENFNKENIKLVYKLIANTRDIISGKGEYLLTYMMISELYNFSYNLKCPNIFRDNIRNLVYNLIECLVLLDNEHPYGSWKDMKYLCLYHLEKDRQNKTTDEILQDGIMNKVINLIVNQLKNDLVSENKSLVAKWIPREKSDKFGWITELLAITYYKDWYNKDLNKNLTPLQISKARRKCLTHFRQTVSKINKSLETTQINQCSSNWKNIDFDKNVTSITMRKQSNAFRNVTKDGKIRSNDDDRIKCSENYNKYIEDCNLGTKNIKGKRISIVDFVKDAVFCNNDIEKNVINLQWDNNSKDNNKLKNVIAMVDTSASMESDNCEPLYSAIGLGIRIAEKSNFGKRVLTFSAKPNWINLDNLDFVETVKTIQKADWGQNTNFRDALDLILDTAIENNIPSSDMQNLTLVILSDMQIDVGKENNNLMFDMMREKYKSYNYNLPHIIFWNLRNTNGFPNLSNEKNTSMMSGINPLILNNFSEKGIDILRDITPFDNLKEILNNNRYKNLEKIVDSIWF